MNRPTFCRFCAVTKPYYELCDLAIQKEYLDDVKRILKFLDIQFVNLSDDALPRSICAGCYFNLKNCYYVFDRVLVSQDVLRDLFSNDYNNNGVLHRSEIVGKRDDDTSSEEDRDVEIVVVEDTVKETTPDPPQPPPATWSTYPHKCNQCRQTYNSFVALKAHYQSAHREFHGFQCADCEIMVPTFHMFVEHVREHRPDLVEYCPVCDIQTKNPEHMNSHPELTQTPAPPPQDDGAYKTQTLDTWKAYQWVCQFCFKKAPDQAALRIHLKQYHKKCFGFKCMDCYMVLKKYETFIDHVTIHHPGLEYKCEYCDFKVKNLREYDLHVNQHKLDYSCPTCGEYFHEIKALQTHMLMYDININSIPKENKTMMKLEEENKELTCNICGVFCVTRYALQQHSLLHTTRAMQFECNECHQTFSSKNDLDIHHVFKHHTQSPEYKTESYKYKSVFTSREKSENERYYHLRKALGNSSARQAPYEVPKPAQATPQVDNGADVLKGWAEIFLANGNRVETDKK